MSFITPKRLYLTEDGRVVEEGDPDARWLFAGAGSEISEADAVKYGLVKKAKAAKVEEPAAAAEEPAGRVFPVEATRQRTKPKRAAKKTS